MSAARPQPQPLPLSFLLVALAWGWLALGVVLLSALAGRAEGGFGDLLALSLTLLPLAWIAGESGHRLQEAGLLGALAFAPALVAAAYSGEAARLQGTLYALSATGLLTCAAAGAPRRWRVLLAAAWGLALPLGLWAWADLGQTRSGALAPLAPALSLREVLGGRPSGAAWGVLACAALMALGVRGARSLPGALAARRARRREPGALALGTQALGALALGTLALGAIDGDALRAGAQERALLGPHLRAQEPAPIELRERSGEDTARRAARSFGHRYLAGPAPGGSRVLPLPLAGHLELERRGPGGWEQTGAPLGHSPLRARDLLVGCFGESAWRAAGEELSPRAKRVRLLPSQAGLLAEGGSAFDLVLVSPGLESRLRGPLRAWAAAGGLVGLSEQRALADLAGPSASLSAEGPLAVQALGAGRAVAPLGSGGWAALGQAMTGRWEERHARRARRAATGEALLLEADPRPQGLNSLASALVALGLLWAALCALALRQPGPRVVAGAWLVALAAGALLRTQLPQGAAWAASRQVLEAPSGERSAARLELISLYRLRPEALQLDLVDYAPPLPAFLSEAEAVNAQAQLTPAGLGPPRIELGPGRGARTYLRLDACELPGALRIEPRLEPPSEGQGGAQAEGLRLTNQLPHALRRIVLQGPGGVRSLAGELGPGESLELRWSAEEAQPLASWRGQAIETEEARWRRLAEAALSGRGGRWVVGAEVPGRRAILSGAAGEELRPALLVVVGPRF